MTTTAAPKQAAEPADPHVGTGTLAAKLARIMGQLDRITRDGKVEGSAGYSYASADALSDILRPALAAEGVVMLPSDVEVIDQRIDEIDKGTYTQTRYTVALRVEWTLTDGETTLTMATVGTGVDYSGKAANAAHTFARVNALKSGFHLSTGEDDEKTQSGGSRTGEVVVPTLVGKVSGELLWAEDGSRMAFRYRTDEDADFEAMKDAVKSIGGRWDKDPRLWIVPTVNAAAAMLIARKADLTLPKVLVERFPEPPADDLAPKDATAAQPLGPGYDPPGTPPDESDDVPF